MKMKRCPRLVLLVCPVLVAACRDGSKGSGPDSSAMGGTGGATMTGKDGGAGMGGSAGDAGSTAGDAPPAASLAELVKQYESGIITRAQFGAGLAAFETSSKADALEGTLDEIVLLPARPAPYVIGKALQIGSKGALLIEAGAVVSIGPRVTVTIAGQLYVLGTADKPVTIAGASKAAAYDTIVISGGRSEVVGAVVRWAQRLFTIERTGMTPILIEDSKLDDFIQSGVEMRSADGMVIRNNQIGVSTAPENATCEALHGESSAVHIEGNTFGRRAGYNDVFDMQPCVAPHNPLI